MAQFQRIQEELITQVELLDVTTLVAGGSVDGMLIKDNAGSGNTLAAATTNDVAVGTYVIDLPYASTLTKNAAILAQFVQNDGSTAATPHSRCCCWFS